MADYQFPIDHVPQADRRVGPVVHPDTIAMPSSSSETEYIEFPVDHVPEPEPNEPSTMESLDNWFSGLY